MTCKLRSVLFSTFFNVFCIFTNNLVAQNEVQFLAKKNDSIKIVALIAAAKPFFSKKPDSAIKLPSRS